MAPSMSGVFDEAFDGGPGMTCSELDAQRWFEPDLKTFFKGVCKHV